MPISSPADIIAGVAVPLSKPSNLAATPAGQKPAESAVISRNPARPNAPDGVVWAGVTNIDHVGEAVRSAREALPAWSRWPAEKRHAVLRRYKAIVEDRKAEIADLICKETGKVMWEAVGEAAALGAKVDITLDDSADGPMRRVMGYSSPLTATREGRCWFRPHGVMAVLGPFNFPMHLANGHIVPALAMGNTVVLKPSDKAPACGQLINELFVQALNDEGWDGPPGVVNCVQGGVPAAKALSTHDGIDGILFTGSWQAGRAILEVNLDRPGRIVALEMGGNNPAVVLPDADLRQAAIEIARCAFNTAGQRCTCTRRAIVHRDVADRLIPAIAKAAGSLVIGEPDAAHPVFMGPLINATSRDAAIAAQRRWAKAGGRVIVEASPIENEFGGAFMSPGVVEVDRFVAKEDGSAGEDIEVFGPLLRVCVVDDFDGAIAQANATRFGLAASVFTQDRVLADRFLYEVRAGCVNVNAGTAGASSKLPFGGLGLSGNHRPAGAFSLDYCAYPVAGMLERGDAAQIATGMTFDDTWIT